MCESNNNRKAKTSNQNRTSHPAQDSVTVPTFSICIDLCDAELIACSNDCIQIPFASVRNDCLQDCSDKYSKCLEKCDSKTPNRKSDL